VEILTWNFRKKLFQETILEILCKPKLSSTKTSEIRTTFCNLLWVCIALKKFTQVLSYVVCTQVRRHVHKHITKKRYGEEMSGRFVSGKPALFTPGLGLTTPYCCGILVWRFYQTFSSVSIVFWLRFELQIRPTRLAINFLSITGRAERKICLCVKLFDFFVGEYSSVWPEIHHVLSQIYWRFVLGISGKNYFGRIFQKFCANKGYLLPKLVKFRPIFCNFICVRIELKKFTQVLSYVVCTQIRRHVHKQISKRWYGEEKSGRFVFRKPIFSLSVWN